MPCIFPILFLYILYILFFSIFLIKNKYSFFSFGTFSKKNIYIVQNYGFPFLFYFCFFPFPSSFSFLSSFTFTVTFKVTGAGYFLLHVHSGSPEFHYYSEICNSEAFFCHAVAFQSCHSVVFRLRV